VHAHAALQAGARAAGHVLHAEVAGADAEARDDLAHHAHGPVGVERRGRVAGAQADGRAAAHLQRELVAGPRPRAALAGRDRVGVHDLRGVQHLQAAREQAVAGGRDRLAAEAGRRRRPGLERSVPPLTLISRAEPTPRATAPSRKPAPLAGSRFTIWPRPGIIDESTGATTCFHIGWVDEGGGLPGRGRALAGDAARALRGEHVAGAGVGLDRHGHAAAAGRVVDLVIAGRHVEADRGAGLEVQAGDHRVLVVADGHEAAAGTRGPQLERAGRHAVGGRPCAAARRGGRGGRGSRSRASDKSWSPGSESARGSDRLRRARGGRARRGCRAGGRRRHVRGCRCNGRRGRHGDDQGGAQHPAVIGGEAGRRPERSPSFSLESPGLARYGASRCVARLSALRSGGPPG
jgi:hypothetical protein